MSGRVEEVTLSPLAAGVAGDAEPSEIGRLVHLALEHGDTGFGGLPDPELKALLGLRAGDRASAADLVAYALAALGSVRAIALAALTGRAVVGRHLLFHTTGVRASLIEPVNPAVLDGVLAKMAHG